MDLDDLIADVINCSLIGLSLFFGTVISLTFISNRELCRTASNKFLVNFLATNFPVAIAGLVVIVRSKQSAKKKELKAQMLVSSILIVSLFSYLLGLLLVTIDRFIAITRPFFYAEKMTGRNVHRIIALFWISVAAFFISAITRVLVDTSNSPVKTSHTILLIASFVGIATLLIINLVIFSKIRRQVRYLNTVSVGDTDSNRRLLRRSERKAAYLCFAMVATQAICWLPHCVTGMVEEYNQGKKHLMRYTTSLYYIALLINAFLYVFWHSEMRRAVKGLFAKCLCRWSFPNNVSVAVENTTQQ